MKYFEEQLEEREGVFRFNFLRASGDAIERLPDELRWMGLMRFFSLKGDPDGLFRWIDPLLSIEGSLLDEFRLASGLSPDLKSFNHKPKLMNQSVNRQHSVQLNQKRVDG